jgi:CDP-diacylglycerol---glycerol-3-phosphate 3-phosphatidyltransferase
MTLRDSRIAGHYYGLLHKGILPLLKRISISPNQLTFVGFGLAVLVPAGFYSHPGYGFALILFSGITDTMDGLLSRIQGNGSIYGAFLDSTLDRASDLLFLAGFWILFWNKPYFLLATSLVFAGFCSTFLISYTKARAESLGGSCIVGFMERPARIVFLLAWALMLSLFGETRQTLLWGGLIFYLLLTTATLIQRLAWIRRQLKRI